MSNILNYKVIEVYYQRCINGNFILHDDKFTFEMALLYDEFKSYFKEDPDAYYLGEDQFKRLKEELDFGVVRNYKGINIKFCLQEVDFTREY